MNGGKTETGGTAVARGAEMAAANESSVQAVADSRQGETKLSSDATEGAEMGAQTLIAAGIVIQLAVFGLGQLSRAAIWAISELASGAWTLFSATVNAPVVHAVAVFWPLMLVAAGAAIWVASKRQGYKTAVQRNEGRER